MSNDLLTAGQDFLWLAGQIGGSLSPKPASLDDQAKERQKLAESLISGSQAAKSGAEGIHKFWDNPYSTLKSAVKPEKATSTEVPTTTSGLTEQQAAKLRAQSRERLERIHEESDKVIAENKKRREQEKREQEERSLDPNPSTQKGSGGQMSKLSYITTPKGHVFEPRDLPSEIEGYYKGPFDSVSLPDSNEPEKHNLATLPVDDGEGDDWDDQLDYYIGLTDTSPYNERSTGKAVLPTGEGGVGLNETDRVLAKQNGPLKATKNKDGTWDFSRDYGEDSQWYDPKIDYDRRRAFLDAPDGQTGYKRALATQGVIRRGNMDFVQDEDGKEYAINSRDVMNGNKTVGAILDELTGVSTEGGDAHPLQEPLALKPEELNLATLPVDFGEDDDGDDQLDYYSGL